MFPCRSLGLAFVGQERVPFDVSQYQIDHIAPFITCVLISAACPTGLAAGTIIRQSSWDFKSVSYLVGNSLE
jgi:hypothetical protein